MKGLTTFQKSYYPEYNLKMKLLEKNNFTVLQNVSQEPTSIQFNSKLIESLCYLAKQAFLAILL